MQSVLQAAGEGHWLRWIEEDIVSWRKQSSTAHHRSAYGGMGSFNDLYLMSAQAEPDKIWLNEALDTLRHIAASVAPSAEQSSDSFRQVPPGLIDNEPRWRRHLSVRAVPVAIRDLVVAPVRGGRRVVLVDGAGTHPRSAWRIDS
jgi:hypothetical protein